MTVTHLPLAWARQLIANAEGPMPEYGSLEWIELPDESRTKVAACVAAAEKWRTRHVPLEIVSAHTTSRRAREIAEARQPRPGDHPGGPVRWERVRDEVAAGE